MWDVNSQSHAPYTIQPAACICFPTQLGWDLSVLKREMIPKQIVNKTYIVSYVGRLEPRRLRRLRILLKHPAPQDSVEIGPEKETDFPQLLKKLQSSLTSFLVSSDC